ncbi:MAG: hypothetical protein LEGION0403_FIIPPAGN_00247 [Legionella sp.]
MLLLKNHRDDFMGKVNVSFSFVNQERLPLIIQPQNEQPLSAEHIAAFLEEKGYEIKIYRSPIMERLGFNHHMVYAKQNEEF